MNFHNIDQKIKPLDTTCKIRSLLETNYAFGLGQMILRSILWLFAGFYLYTYKISLKRKRRLELK